SVAVLSLMVAARPVRVHATDPSGPLSARCGVGVYLFGHPNAVVERACHESYEGRALVLGLASAVIVVATAILVFKIATAGHSGPGMGPSRRGFVRLVDSPSRAAVAVLTGVAFVVGAAALRTVAVHLSD